MFLKDKVKNFIYFLLNIFICFICLKKASILMYHSIDNNDIFFNVTPEDFERQMKYLKRKGYKVVRLVELVEKLRKKEEINPKTVVITLDDGFKDNYINALPILKKYGFPATIFLSTAYMGRKMENSFGHPLDIMDWDEAREMEASGLIDFGCHSHTHPAMEKLNLKEFIYEVQESSRLLKRHLENPVMIFAYPKGIFKKEQLDYLKKVGFLAGVKVDEGLVGGNDDLLTLRRNLIYSKGGFSQFKGKLCATVEIFNFFNNLLRK